MTATVLTANELEILESSYELSSGALNLWVQAPSAASSISVQLELSGGTGTAYFQVGASLDGATLLGAGALYEGTVSGSYSNTAVTNDGQTTPALYYNIQVSLTTGAPEISVLQVLATNGGGCTVTVGC